MRFYFRAWLKLERALKSLMWLEIEWSRTNNWYQEVWETHFLVKLKYSILKSWTTYVIVNIFFIFFQEHPLHWLRGRRALLQPVLLPELPGEEGEAAQLLHELHEGASPQGRRKHRDQRGRRTFPYSVTQDLVQDLQGCRHAPHQWNSSGKLHQC